MGQQIIKQPNGKYCLFSSIVDNITCYDMTPEEIVDFWTEQSREDFERKVKEIIGKLESGEKPYHQFTLSFDECIETIREIHGESESDSVRKMIDINTLPPNNK